MVTLLAVVVRLVEDALRWLVLLCRSTKSLEAENLFLRRQLALYIERGVKPRRLDVATRVSLVVLSKLFDWRNALVVVQPATLIRWHRAGWKLLWRVESRRGRPRIPKDGKREPSVGRGADRQRTAAQAGHAHLSANRAQVLAETASGAAARRPTLVTFLKNHATATLACDFFIAVTATFRMLYMFVVIEHGTRHLAHVNVTAHRRRPGRCSSGRWSTTPSTTST